MLPCNWLPAICNHLRVVNHCQSANSLCIGYWLMVPAIGSIWYIFVPFLWLHTALITVTYTWSNSDFVLLWVYDEVIRWSQKQLMVWTLWMLINMVIGSKCRPDAVFLLLWLQAMSRFWPCEEFVFILIEYPIYMIVLWYACLWNLKEI